MVLELISHVDAQIDAESLRAFVAAYQTVSSLKMGELWAVPIMLRLALIENLRRVTARLMVARHDRDLADLWVDRLQDMAEKHPSHLVVVVADMAKAELPLSSAFVAEFCQRLSRQNPVVHLARSWLEQRLAEQGLSIEQLVHLESQNQAADQVSISHTITSLRFLSATDWREFVEDLSVVEQTLAHRPGGGLRRDGFFHARSLSPFGRGPRPAQPVLRSGRRAPRHRTGRDQRAGERAQRSHRPCGLLSDRQRAGRAGERDGGAVAVANAFSKEPFAIFP